MNLIRLILRNIEGNAFRNWVVFLCAGLMAAFALTATLLIGGARQSLSLAKDRLGADIVVLPEGSEEQMENAFLMGVPARFWMSDVVEDAVAEVDGVEKVSSQLYLATLKGVLCCSISEMFLVVYDPDTDFTLRPWMDEHLSEAELKVGDAIGGAYVFEPEGADSILVYGYDVNLIANLDITGTGIDQTMFLPMATAEEIARVSYEKAEEILDIPVRAISAILVRVEPGRDIDAVAADIETSYQGIVAVTSTNLFQNHRGRLNGLLTTMLILVAITWVLSLALIALVFSMAINERKQEIGVMRALGAKQSTVLITLLSEGLLIALIGGMAGTGLGLTVIYALHNFIVFWMGVPFLLPEGAALVSLILSGLLFGLISVLPAVFIPTVRISRMDPVLAMRA